MSFALASERLVLRPPEPGDVEALWPHVSNPALTTYLAWDPHRDREVTRALVDGLRRAQEAGVGYHWLVFHEETLVGLVSLIDVRHKHLTWTLDRAEIAYWIAPEFQRRGFAVEASAAVLGFGFRELGLEKIRVAHAAENEGSRIVSERLGFRKYARERKAFAKGGQWHDLIWYDLLRDEFL